jgi:hypothetical protein
MGNSKRNTGSGDSRTHSLARSRKGDLPLGFDVYIYTAKRLRSRDRGEMVRIKSDADHFRAVGLNPNQPINRSGKMTHILLLTVDEAEPYLEKLYEWSDSQMLISADHLFRFPVSWTLQESERILLALAKLSPETKVPSYIRKDANIDLVIPDRRIKDFLIRAMVRDGWISDETFYLTKSGREIIEGTLVSVEKEIRKKEGKKLRKEREESKWKPKGM